MNTPRRTFLRCAILLASAACVATGQDNQTKEQESAKLPYRRVYVPEADLPTEARGLLPLKRDEFERRVAAAAASSAAPMANGRIVEAEYSATLNEYELVDGKAALTVQLDDDSEPVWLSLEPSNLAISSATWNGGMPRAAVLGRATSGDCSLLVEQTSALNLDWSSRGRPEVGGGWRFDLQIPPALRSRFKLALPAGHTLTSSAGVVRGPHDQPSDDSPAADDVERPLSNRPWTIELGGLTRTTLVVEPTLADSRQQPLVLVREAATYRFSPGHLDVEFALDLDIYQQPLKQLVLLVDQPLAVVAVRSGEQRLTWHETAEDASGARRLVIELSEPLAGSGRSLSISAASDWAPLLRQTLPRVRLEGGTWQQGTAALLSNAELQLDAISGDGCRQTAVDLAAAPLQPDSLQFEYFLEGGRIEAATSSRNSGLRVMSGLAVVVDTAQTGATFVADIATTGGERFDLSATASRQWVIESVETSPAELLEDRTITKSGPDEQQLKIRLRHPLGPEQAVRLIVRARRQKPREGETLPADFLQFLKFDEAREQKQLISLSSADPALEPMLAGDLQAIRRDAAEASAEELALFEAPPGPIFLETDGPRSRSRVVLRRGEPRFSADVVLSSQATRSRLTSEVRITCKPESSSVSAVIVRASPPPASEIVWSIESDSGAGVIVKPLTKESQGEPDAARESLWQLQLQRPSSSPFVIVGRWAEPFGGPRLIPLISLPEATSQGGMVEALSLDGTAISFEHQGVSRLPLSALADNQYSHVRARFRYEPGRRAALRVSPREPTAAAPALWVRDEVVTSIFSESGDSSHRVVLQLENLGAERLSLRIDPSVKLDEATIDGQSMPLGLRTDAAGIVSLALPTGVRYPTVRLQYTSSTSPASHWPATVLSAPLPQLNIPCLQKQWIVRLAPGLKQWPAGRGNGGASTSLATTESKPIDLFSAPLWRSMLRGAWAQSGGERGVNLDAESPPGWTSYRSDLPETSHATFTVYRPQLVQAFALAAALGAFAVVAWRRMRRPRWLLLLAAIGIVATWLVPLPLASVLAGGAVGLLAAALWCLHDPIVNRPRPLDNSSESRQSTQAFAGQGAALLLFFGWLFGNTWQAGAQELAATPPAGGGRIQRVVFPVDDNQQPAGDYVYLSPELYEALHRLSEEGNRPSESWLVRAAIYDVTLTADETTSDLQLQQVAAMFEVQTFKADVDLLLPFRREEIHLLEGGSTLNGQPFVPQWTDGGDGLTLSVKSPGRHKVEIHFSAAFRRRDNAFEADLTVPKVAASRVVVHQPGGDAHCEFPSALGATFRPDEMGTVAAELGPAGQLRLRASRSNTNLKSDVSVDQRLWWKVRPSSVIVDGRFDFSASEGRLQRISLRVDPRLRLLPLDSTSSIARQWIEEGDLNTLHFELAQPYPAEASLHASFLVVGATGIGNFVPPRIEAVADQFTRHWQAMSVSPGWEADLPRSDLAPAEFARQWSGAAQDPLLSWNAAELKDPPTLSIRPSASRPAVEQALDCSFDRSGILLRFQATVGPAAPGRFQYRISAPAAVKVRQVTVTEDDVPVPMRWWQTQSGSIVVLLAQQSAATHRLEIEAESTRTRQNALAVPLLEMQDVDLKQSQVRLFRQRDVALTLDQLTGFAATDVTLGDYTSDLGRLVGQYLASGPALSEPRQVRIRVAENAAEVTGNLITAVRRTSNTWNAELHCNLDIAQGVLDTLRFEIPEEWSGPFEIVPAVDHSVIAIPGQSRKQLVIRPQRAASQHLELMIRSPLAMPAAEVVRAPNIELLESPRVTRYLALANRSSDQPVAWETNGLQAVALHADEWPAGVAADRFEAFHVVASRFEALVRSEGTVFGQPRLRLADIDLTWQRDRRFFGVARFNLHPAGLGHCTLAIPSDCQLAGLTVGGATADAVRLGDRAWRISLSSSQLPQTIEASFVGRLPVMQAELASVQFAAPLLEEIPVDRTLWTIRGPADVGAAASPGAVFRSTSQVEQDLYRLTAAVQSLEAVASIQGAAVTGSDSAGWMLTATQRFAELQQRVQLQLADLPLAQRQSLESKFLARVDDYRAIAERLGLAAGMVNESKNTRTAVDDVSPAGLPLRFDSIGALEPISLTYDQVEPSQTLSGRWLALCLIVVGAIGASFGGRMFTLKDWLQANGCLLLALLGVAAWMCLPLGWLGWLIVAATVLGALRMPWPTARRSADGYRGR